MRDLKVKELAMELEKLRLSQFTGNEENIDAS